MSSAHYARIADLYDSFVLTNIDIPFFMKEGQRANGPILELMAGTGRVTLPLLEAGLSVTAVDYSPEMLNHLRQKLAARGLTAAVHTADIRQLDLGQRFRQIILPFQAFPELTTTADQQAALERIHAHLAADGEFICTLHNPRLRLAAVDGQLHLAGKLPLPDGERFIWLLQTYQSETRLVKVLEFFEDYDAHGLLTAKRFSEIQFHLLEQAAFEALIAAAGFTIAHLYGNYAYTPFDPATSPFLIYVLRRKG
jgi:SAM-dependent methyltransferase